MIKKYFIHLIKNWKVSLHSLGDFIVHFIHGLFPFIKIKHQQPNSSDDDFMQAIVDLVTISNIMRDKEELLDRLTEKKEIKLNEFGYYGCPTCGFSLFTDDNFCGECGQALFFNMENSETGKFVGEID